MHIFRINKAHSGSAFTKRPNANAIAPSTRRAQIGGAILANKVYEDNTLRKTTDNLRNLKISKPRMPKKYISFE